MATPDGSEKEHRVALRRRVLKSARIYCEDGRSAIDCMIRNISDTGVQIDTEVEVELPGAFLLCFKDGPTRKVELVWQKANLVGLRFVECQRAAEGEPLVAAEARPALVARIADIERQLAELRTAIMNGELK